MYITINVHEIYLRTAFDLSACTSHVHWYIHLTYIEKIKMYIVTYIVIKCTLDVHFYYCTLHVHKLYIGGTL